VYRRKYHSKDLLEWRDDFEVVVGCPGHMMMMMMMMIIVVVVVREVGGLVLWYLVLNGPLYQPWILEERNGTLI
jgi:hypothetical protein